MIKKRVFAVLSVILVLALSVVPVFASEVESEPEDWYVDLPTDISVTYNLSFQDSYITDFNIHSITYPLVPYIPLTGIVDFYFPSTWPRISVESGSRKLTLVLDTRGTSVISDYSHSSKSGSVRFDYDSIFGQSINKSTASFVTYLNFWELSAGDFFAFSHEDYDDLDFDQNSQLFFLFDQSFISDFCDASECYVSFSYAPITDSGLGEFTDFSSDFLSFATSFGDSYAIDPGSLIRSPSSQGEVDFYLIRDFSLVLVPNSSHNVQTIPSGSYNKYFTFVPFFNCSFAYDPRFDDPGFLDPGGAMELRDYTSWITTAVSGFFEIQIFPGFYLSGFLMVVIAFACVIWFLKIFAGG